MCAVYQTWSKYLSQGVTGTLWLMRREHGFKRKKLCRIWYDWIYDTVLACSRFVIKRGLSALAPLAFLPPYSGNRHNACCVGLELILAVER